MGPNGAGITTLLKNIIGYLQASSGTVDIQGQPLASLKSDERASRLSYLSQETGENLIVPAEHGEQARFYGGDLKSQYEQLLKTARVVEFEDLPVAITESVAHRID